MHENVSFASSKQVTRWWPLAGGVGPLLFVIVFTLAGGSSLNKCSRRKRLLIYDWR